MRSCGGAWRREGSEGMCGTEKTLERTKASTCSEEKKPKTPS